MSRLPAQVATVLTNSLLAFNVGSNQGVAESDRVFVLRIVEINDPATGEKLGDVAVTKLMLSVNHVQPKLCTAVVTSLQDDPSPNPARVRKTKRIVEDPFNEKAGQSVYVQVGDPVEIDIKDQSGDGFSDEPPF